MRFMFEIPTPESCVTCKFHTLVTDGRYGQWVFKCLISDSIKMFPRDGLHQRHPDCPGKLSNNGGTNERDI